LVAATAAQPVTPLPGRSAQPARVAGLRRLGMAGHAVPAPLGDQLTSQSGLTRSPFSLAHSVTREGFMHRIHFSAPEDVEVR
jgi:hypothetical protein